ncbi:hypothetical protein EV1_034596 [Malus domestica]|nr:F-box protein SKIP22-like [Malus domestica]
MKLRLRLIETKETIRVEVPDLCSLHHLKQTVSQLISAAPSSLRLSLNRRNELHAPSPHDPLRSLGITSGDLVFYTLDPSSQALASPLHPISHSSAESPNRTEPQCSNFLNSETLIDEGAVLADLIAEEQRSGGSNSETLVVSGAECMDIDDPSDGLGLKKYSVPFFLKRVLREELGDDHSNHKLLVIAVHAVLLESGFVGFDSISGMLADQRTGSTISLSYTLPEILRNRGNTGKEVERVVLKFQNLGHFVNVYGSLANGGSSPYQVCLDKNRFAPTIEFVYGTQNVNDRDGFVLELSKIVKDGITFPLLIDLCAKAGLPAPPSLMRLPPELKMKILEPLAGVDIAKVGCVSKELQNLGNNDELWKQKYTEEFGNGSGGEGTGGEGTVTNWKFRFVGNWETRKQQMKAVVRWRSFERPYFNLIRRDPNPFVPPRIGGIIGGDYDRFPLFGAIDPTGQAHPLLQQPRRSGMRRNFSPNCDLGGFNI